MSKVKLAANWMRANRRGFTWVGSFEVSTPDQREAEGKVASAGRPR